MSQTATISSIPSQHHINTVYDIGSFRTPAPARSLALESPWGKSLGFSNRYGRLLLLFDPPDLIPRLIHTCRAAPHSAFAARTIFQIAERLSGATASFDSTSPDTISGALEPPLALLLGSGYQHVPPFYVGLGRDPMEPTYDFALAFHSRRIDEKRVLQALMPVWRGRVCSFTADAWETLGTGEGSNLEGLCEFYDRWKPYLIERRTAICI